MNKAFIVRESFEAKDTSFDRILKESPRLSHDERTSYPSSLDTKEGSIVSLSLRELPKLSLDSRVRTLRGSKFDLKPEGRADASL